MCVCYAYKGINIYIYIDIEKNTFEVGPGVPCAAY